MKAKGYDFTKARRGAIVKSTKSKTLLAIRIDNDILEWFRKQVHKTGGGN